MKKAAWMLFGVLALALSGMASPAVAQDNYPVSPFRLVVGFPPGGTADVSARLMAMKLSAQMNTNVIVENKPGAGGNIGAEFVAKSTPNGHTLLYNSAGVVLSPALGEKLGYDVLKDLAPVALVSSGPLVLTVSSSGPVNTVAEFIAYVRANPGKLAYGSAGTGSMTHLGPLLFLQSNGLAALHVPYKGASPALIDLLAGRIQFAMQTMPSSAPLVRDKRIKGLAISSLKRSPLLSDVPTLNETVMPGFEVGAWNGVMVPAKTPPAIVKRLNNEIMKALQEPDIIRQLAHEGLEPLGSTAEEYGAYLRGELERWTKLMKSVSSKLD